MTKIYIYSVFAFLFINLTINAQENLYLNQNKLLGALNPSFYGFKEAANIGVANTNQKISNEDSYIHERVYTKRENRRINSIKYK